MLITTTTIVQINLVYFLKFMRYTYYVKRNILLSNKK